MKNNREILSTGGFERKKITENGRMKIITVVDFSRVDPHKPPPSDEVLKELLKIVQKAPKTSKLYGGRPRF